MKKLVWIVVVPLLAGCVAQAEDRPVITSPAQDAKISGFRAEAEGRIAKGRVPFFAVEPAAVSPQTWIQPRVHSAGDDGTVTGTIYLGEEDNGAGQKFRIYLLACRSNDPFGGEKVIQRVPKSCVASGAVTVERVR